jgi:predicted Ser/Thr protein kinase
MDNFTRDLNVHPDFFVPFNVRKPADHFYDFVQELVPSIWRLKQDYFWTYVQPRQTTRVVQGWKIHVSSLPENAETTLERVVAICVDMDTEFKFASDHRVLRQLLSKNCSRSASGKFITIYPKDTDDFKEMLERLHLALKDLNGPYILSDRQYKDSRTVFYRYGGFRGFSSTNVNGDKVSYILDEKHNYVEDQRKASFYLPEFTRKDYEDIFKSIAEEAQTSAKSNTINSNEAQPQSPKEESTNNYFGGKYEIMSVIKASNAGGVYVAKNAKTDESVLLKEARPCIGINSAGSDVIQQLNKEFRILDKLSKTGIAPQTYGLFNEWEHVFLAQEMIEGITLRQFQVKSNKIIHSSSTNEQMQNWIQTITSIAKSVISSIIKLHEQNIIFGDLSPNNVMINEETLKTTLIDFEGAYEPGVDKPVNIFTPGFAENARMDRDVTDFSDDYFALGATLVSMIMPNTCLMQLKSDYVDSLFKELQHDIGLPNAYIEVTKALLADKNVDLHKCIQQLDSIQAAKLHAFDFKTAEKVAEIEDFSKNAVPGIFKYNLNVMNTKRSDRVFPMGPSMDDPLAIDKGILGVAYAWNTINKEIPAELKQWIDIKAVESHKERLPGLLNGCSGAAWSLANLGYHDEAIRVLRYAAHHKNLYQKMSLGYGAAGFGLASLYVWQQTQEQALLDKAIKIANVICDSAIEHENGLTWDDIDSETGADIGLYEGSSGIALFLLTIYCQTQDSTYLEFGEKALAFDLSYRTETNGSVGFPRNTNETIIYPYLAYGSAGIASVALRYYLVTQNQSYLEVVHDVKSGIAHKYTLNSGIANGLSGLGSYMLDVYQFLGDEAYLELAYNVASGLKMFEVVREEGITFPDSNRMKVCSDFYDGSAGIALFLDRLNNQTTNKNFMMDEVLISYLESNSH